MIPVDKIDCREVLVHASLLPLYYPQHLVSFGSAYKTCILLKTMQVPLGKHQNHDVVSTKSADHGLYKFGES